MFGAIETFLDGVFQLPGGRDEVRLFLDFDGRQGRVEAVITTHPPRPSCLRTCSSLVPPVGRKVATAVTPETRGGGAVGDIDLQARSRRAGVMMLDLLEGGAFLCARTGQVTEEVISMFAPFSLLVSVPMQPVAGCFGVTGFGFLGDRECGAVDFLGVDVRIGLERVERGRGLGAQLLLGLGGEQLCLALPALVRGLPGGGVEAVEGGDHDEGDQRALMMTSISRKPASSPVRSPAAAAAARSSPRPGTRPRLTQALP